MEEAQAAVTAHLDQVSGLVQSLSSELRRGIGPAADSLLAFVRAVDWTEPWLMCLMAFHASLLLTAVGLRRHPNLQFFLLFLAYSGVYLAEKINSYLTEHWKSFASRNTLTMLEFSSLLFGPAHLYSYLSSMWLALSLHYVN